MRATANDIRHSSQMNIDQGTANKFIDDAVDFLNELQLNTAAVDAKQKLTKVSVQQVSV